MAKGDFRTPLLVGEKFNKLKILGEGTHKVKPCGRTKRMVKVECDCGVVCEKDYGYVKRGETKSCGKCPKEAPYNDISGIRRGRLEVVSFSRRAPKEGGVYWNCKCDCGRTVEYLSKRLVQGDVYNCGKCGSSTKKSANYIEDEAIVEKDGYACIPLDFTEDKKSYKVVILDDKLTEITVNIGNYRAKSFINPNQPRVQGVGYYGQGKYLSKVDGQHTEEYADWRGMMVRCYSGRYPSYKDVRVCKDWHNFQVFAEWANENGICKSKSLDKDLIVKGSKIYSPETCSYLPKEINSFIKRENHNGLPLGVDEVELVGSVKYRSQGSFEGTVESYGTFDTIEEAFLRYKNRKENIAKVLADKYKDTLDERAYVALINYDVSIDD